MKIVITGINHEQLNLDERKNYYFTDSDKLSFSTCLLDYEVHQTVILSTCNRSEVVVCVDDSFDEEIIRREYASFFHQESDLILLYTNEEAIQYLLEVTCGIRSQVLGEDQIIHQVKESYLWAHNKGFTKKELNYLFQNVLKFAKRMRSEYAISEHPLSISYIGYQSVASMLSKDDAVMICGSGEMSQLMLKYLEEHSIYLVNRTYHKVKQYINDTVHYVAFEDREKYLPQVKLIVTATSSPHYIFKKDMNIHGEHIFLDLAIPRDVDPALKSVCTVIDMDNLKAVSNEQYENRQKIAKEIKHLCSDFTKDMVKQLQDMEKNPLLEKMNRCLQDISEETYELLLEKLDLSSKDAFILKKVLKASFARVIKEQASLIRNENRE